jgi:hypothetical protein
VSIRGSRMSRSTAPSTTWSAAGSPRWTEPRPARRRRSGSSPPSRPPPPPRSRRAAAARAVRLAR